MNCIPYLSPLDACVMKVRRTKLISGRCWKVHCCLASGIKQLYFNFTRSWVKINFLASIEVCIFEIKLETLLILLVFNLSHFSFEFENFKCQRDSNSASAITLNDVWYKFPGMDCANLAQCIIFQLETFVTETHLVKFFYFFGSSVLK